MDKLHEESRKQFEEWVCNEYPWGADALSASFWQGKHDSSDGYYIVGDQYDCLYWSYIGWKASRESIVVELPQRQSLCASGYGDGYFVPSDYGDGLEYDETVESIRSIGLSIKGE